MYELVPEHTHIHHTHKHTHTHVYMCIYINNIYTHAHKPTYIIYKFSNIKILYIYNIYIYIYIYMPIIMIWQNAFYKWIRDNLSNWNCWIMSAFSVFPVLIYNRHFNLRYLSQESLSVFRFYFNRDKSNELYLLATCNGAMIFLVYSLFREPLLWR